MVVCYSFFDSEADALNEARSYALRESCERWILMYHKLVWHSVCLWFVLWQATVFANWHEKWKPFIWKHLWRQH